MDRTIVTMERKNGKIYIVETVIFQDETFVTNHLRVNHNDKLGWHVILPDMEVISADRLKTIYHARKNIMIRFNDSEFWCYLNGDNPYRYF